ncbi:MAG: hypothetical protein NTY48_06015, partial [Candidatus Diapherotrites archaeon]|nr:hypothetical protein [Candidatus Diapherotrites archaeon]
VGVKILEGRLRDGWMIMNKEGKIMGKVAGMQNEGKSLKEAKRGEEIAVSIDGANVGRNLFEGDHLYSCIPVKQYCSLEKYLDDFSSDEKVLYKEIKDKQKTIDESK